MHAFSVLILLAFASAVRSQSCTTLVDPVEIASAAAAIPPLVCGQNGVVCDSASGQCSIVSTTGSVEYSSASTLTAISFPELTSVGNIFRAQSVGALQTISVPKLQSVGTSFSVRQCQSMTTITAPALATAPSGINLFNNIILQAAIFPLYQGDPNAFMDLRNCYQMSNINLASMTQANQLYIQSSTAVATTTLTSLNSVDYFYMSSLAITSVDLPALTNGLIIQVSNCAQVTTVDMPLLTSIQQLSFQNLDALTTINTPVLSTATSQFSIQNNQMLSFVNTSQLTRTGSFSIINNAVLSTLSAPLLTQTSVITIRSNAQLSSIALPLLVTVNGALTIESETALTSLTVCPAGITTSMGQCKFPNDSNCLLCQDAAFGTPSCTINDGGSCGTLAPTPQPQGTCSTLVDAAEIATAAAAEPALVCGASATCTADSGQCSIVRVNTDLTFSSTSGITVISLPQLENVTGELQIVDVDTVTSVSMPRLYKATETVSINNNLLLSTVNLDSLAELNVNGIQVQNNEALTGLSFPGLKQTTRQITIQNNPKLASVSFPALLSSGRFDLHNNGNNIGGPAEIYSFPLLVTSDRWYISSHANLNTITWPSMTSVYLFSIYSNTGLVTISAPLLTSLANDINFNNNGALTTISLPELVTIVDDVYINSNPELTVLNLDKLTEVGPGGTTSTSGRLQIHTLAKLPSLSFPELLAIKGEFRVFASAVMTSISAPKLTLITDELEVLDMPMLTTVDLPALTFARFVNIEATDNPMLATVNICTTTLNTTDPSNPVSCEYPGDAECLVCQDSPFFTATCTVNGGMSCPAPPTPTVPPGECATLEVQSEITTALQANPRLTCGTSAVCRNVSGTCTIVELRTDLSFGSSATLTTVSLPNLENITGGINIDDADSITTVSLPKLTRVTNPITVINNAALTTFSVPLLQRLVGSGSCFVFSTNGGSIALSLPSVTTVSSCTINVRDNTGLTSFSMDSVTAIHQLDFNDNAATTTVSFASAASAGYMYLNTNPLLASLEFPELTIASTIQIQTSAISSLDFPKLVSISPGDLYLNVNSALVNISFPLMRSVQDDIYILNHANLQNMNFSSLQTIGVGTSGFLQVNSAPKLMSAHFPSLTSINGRMSIYSNDQMTTVNLPVLTTVTGTQLSIYNLPALTSIDLSSLTSTGAISIPSIDNPMLSTVSLCTTQLMVGGSLCVFPGDNNCQICQSSAFQTPSCTVSGDMSCPTLAPTTAPPGSCSVLVNVDEIATAAQANPPLICGSNAICKDTSGTCHIVKLFSGLVIPSTATLTNVYLPELQNITGNLHVINADTVVNITLPKLERLEGDFFVDIRENNGLKNIKLPSLVDHGTASFFRIQSNSGSHQLDVDLNSLEAFTRTVYMNSNSALRTLSMNSLTSTQLFFIQSNNQLETLNLPMLTSTGSSFYLTNNPVLLEIDMPSLTTVTQQMYIQNNYKATKFNVPNLQTVTDDIYLSGNNEVLNITFPSLTRVGPTGSSTGARFSVLNHNKLQVLSAPLLTTVKGELQITTNPQLTSVNLNSLDTVYLKFWLGQHPNLQTVNLCPAGITTQQGSTPAQCVFPGDDNCLICQNSPFEAVTCTVTPPVGCGTLAPTPVPAGQCTTLTDPVEIASAAGTTPVLQCGASASCELVNSVCRIVRINSDLSVPATSSLTGISLPELVNVTGDIRIESSQSIISVSLPKLENVENIVYVNNNNALTSFSAPNLRQANNIDFRSNSVLTAVDLPSITSMTSQLRVQSNSALQTLSMNGLESASSLYIYSNPLLSTVNFNNLKTTTSTITFGYNVALTNLDFPLLDIMPCCGDLRIHDNDELVTINFAKLTQTGDDMLIYRNDKLTTLNFPELLQVGASSGYFQIYQNPLLTTMNLPKLNRITSYSRIHTNTALVTLDLKTLTQNSNYMEIYNNAALQLVDLRGLTSALRLNIDSANNPMLSEVWVCPTSLTVNGNTCAYPNDSNCEICQDNAGDTATCKLVLCGVSDAPTTAAPSKSPTVAPTSAPVSCDSSTQLCTCGSSFICDCGQAASCDCQNSQNCDCTRIGGGFCYGGNSASVTGPLNGTLNCQNAGSCFARTASPTQSSSNGATPVFPSSASYFLLLVFFIAFVAA